MTVPDSLAEAISTEGFVLVGVTPAIESPGYANLVDWIESGFAAGMNYFADRRDAYRHPDGVLPGTQSVIALAYPYAASADQAIQPGQGRVARYAWSGVDYHDVIHPKLKRIIRQMKRSDPNLNARGVVDTAPLMEREVAQAAGIGWRGKNTLVLNKQWGSYFFLACILVDRDISPSLPTRSDPQKFPAIASHHCGTCTACIDQCPTDAFVSPGVLDARRCISYWTIEHDGPIVAEMRAGMGDWVFGCDVCQQVCPWNRKRAREDPPKDSVDHLDLPSLFRLDDEEFRKRFRKTPMWRTRRRGLLRNAAIVLGNQGNSASIASLGMGLSDVEPVVRGAVAWALGQIDHPDALASLKLSRPLETDPEVRAEIDLAIANQTRAQQTSGGRPDEGRQTNQGRQTEDE